MVTAYPVRGKAKSTDICRAFVDGCGGSLVHAATELAPGPAFFYGVDDSNLHLYRAARKRGDFYYCDNSTFDEARQAYFRVTRDALQHSGYGSSSGERFAALGLEIKPWRDGGEHIVVCPQSESFMRQIAGYDGDWATDTLQALKAATKRPVRLRLWNRDKGALAATLQADLFNAYTLVTYSSAAAVTALLAGVPVVATAPESCAARLSGRLFGINELPRPADPLRQAWANVLADNQFSMDEMRSGFAWASLTKEALDAAA